MKTLYIHVALLLVGSVKICPAAGELVLSLIGAGNNDARPPQETAADLTDFRSEVPTLESLAARAVINTKPKDTSLDKYLKKGGAPADAPTLQHAINSAEAIQRILQIFQKAAYFISLDGKHISTKGKKTVARWLQDHLAKVAEGSPVLPARPHHIEVLNRVLYKAFDPNEILEERALGEATYLLTKAGADVDHYVATGNTLLIREIQLQNPLHVKILLENGANVNKHDPLRFSPLMNLISNGLPDHWKNPDVREIVELLLQHGAIVTPEMLAPRANMPPDILSKLQKAYASQQATAAQGAAAAPAAH